MKPTESIPHPHFSYIPGSFRTAEKVIDRTEYMYKEFAPKSICEAKGPRDGLELSEY